MSDAYYPPQQPFPYSSYPAQLSNPLGKQQMAQPPSAVGYLAALQSQLRGTGQVNADLMRQHEARGGDAGMRSDGMRGMGTGGGGGGDWNQQAGPSTAYAPQPTMSLRNHNRQRSNSHHSSEGGSRSHSPPSQAMDEDAGSKVAGKRGRRKKAKEQDEDELAIDDGEEADTGPRKRGRAASLSANEKRKLQNRAAQRAFRERKEKHVRDLEDKVAQQAEQMAHMRDMLERINSENQALRRGEVVPPTPDFQLPPVAQFQQSTSHPTSLAGSPHSLDDLPHHSLDALPPQQQQQQQQHQQQRPRPLLPLQYPPQTRSASPPLSFRLQQQQQQQQQQHQHSMQTYSFSTSSNTPGITIPQNLTIARTPISMERGGETPDGVDGFANFTSTNGQQQQQQRVARREQYEQESYITARDADALSHRTNVMDDEFDFDFDHSFENKFPLPPLFQDMFEKSYSNALVTPSNDLATPLPHFHSSLPPLQPPIVAPTEAVKEEVIEDGEDCYPLSPSDDAEPPALPNGRIPCDKPECDFSLVSCALPIPWRPEALAGGVSSKDVWGCKQAWGKLCSHPLFSECDVDELCHELRDKTRCSVEGSAEGSLVIHKNDVCAVFKSIPARARARRAAAERLRGVTA